MWIVSRRIWLNLTRKGFLLESHVLHFIANNLVAYDLNYDVSTISINPSALE